MSGIEKRLKALLDATAAAEENVPRAIIERLTDEELEVLEREVNAARRIDGRGGTPDGPEWRALLARRPEILARLPCLERGQLER
ncbi:MAG TPA: hypothetical protein VGP38_10405, partial [Rubrobacter sp.]|nr:hypothetical protein [Rubrobacter sp.]